ncbi:MAG: hypothetical protein JRJ44_01365 [Deltaproteobacteria bacterium]|nr:hypothetical protein [Deltaproteobacteria bacterium]
MESIIIILYNILITVFFILVLPFFSAFAKRRRTVLKRLGLTGIKTDKNISPVWIHALSVGELTAVVPLIDQLRNFYGKNEIVVSVTTKTGYVVANNLLKKKVGCVFFFPFDLIFSVKQVLKKINPALIVINETDIWPNFLSIVKKKGISIILINAKLSRTFFKFKFFFKKLFLNFDVICVESKKHKKFFQLLGYPEERLVITGNTKFDFNAPLFDLKRIEALKAEIGINTNQKIITAGSTHKGEEVIIKEAFFKLKTEIKDLVLIIAPRNPLRGYELLKLFKNFNTALLSKTKKITDSKDVIIIDKIGILKKFYAICDLAFVGGSLINEGGHNPLEPAAYSKPVLTGVYTNDFKRLYETLIKSEGTKTVFDAEDFYKKALSILKDPKKNETMGKANNDVLNSNKGAAFNISKVITQCNY